MSSSLLNLSELENGYRLPETLIFPASASIAMAIVSGVLLYAGQNMDLVGAPLLGFISLIPLLIAIEGKRTLSTFFLAFISFFIYLALTIWWIERYGILALAGLVIMEATVYAFAFGLYNFIRKRSRGKDPWLLTLPMLISIVEFKRAIGPWAFPWAYMAHSQCTNLVFIQSASIWGIFGVGFLLVWTNVFIYHLFRSFPNRTDKLIIGFPLLIILALNLLWGNHHFKDESFKENPSFPATIAQRAIGTDVAWTPDFDYRAWMDYEQMTRKQIDPTQGKPGFVVWPENSIPDLIQFRLPGVVQLANASRRTFIIGTLTWKPESANYDSDYTESWFHIYNSVVAVVPDHGISGIYSKVHVVPFGETIPMRQYLSILDYPWGDKNLNEGRTLDSLPTPYGNVGAVVCYESCFPQITRKLILDGAKYLFLVSNTSWFGRSVATYQHARYDTFRAVENNCYFVRAATTGVSSAIDPRGRILYETKPFVAEAFSVDVHPLTELTIYTILGDWVTYISLIWFVIKMMVIFRPPSEKPLTIVQIEK